MKTKILVFLLTVLAVIGLTLGVTVFAEENSSSDGDVARITGVVVLVNGVAQPEGDLRIKDGDTVTIIYSGENFDKLTSNYKYKVGANSGNLMKSYYVTVDTSVTPNTATRTYKASQLTSTTWTTISYTNAGESETVSGYTIKYGEEVIERVAEITGVTVKVDGVEMPVGELNIKDAETVEIVYYGENFDELTVGYNYRIGSYSGQLSASGGFTIDTSVTPNTATRTFNASQLTGTAVAYTNSGETETVSGYTFAYGEEEEVTQRVAKITGVIVKIDGVEQPVGILNISEVGSFEVIYLGENLDKLTSGYKYVVGSNSGNFQYGGFTVDATAKTATKTFSSSSASSTTKISYTNPGEAETVSGYTINIVKRVARITGVTVKVNGAVQPAGEFIITSGDTVEIVYQGENFDKLVGNSYKYRIGNGTGPINSTNFAIDTTVTPNTATRKYEGASINNLSSKSWKTITYTNAGESEIVSEYTIRFTYAVNLPTELDGGNVTADKSFAAADELVTLSVTPADGYELESITVTDARGNGVTVTDGKFTMPSADVTVTATFVKNEVLPDAAFYGASLSAGVDLTMNYYVTLSSAIPEGETLSVRFTMNGKTVTVTDYAYNGDIYIFSFTKIAPQCMNDSIKAEVMVGDTVIGEHDGHSVRKYAEGVLGLYANDAEMIQLVVDILNYGAAAQLYAGHNTDNLVNAGITAAGTDALPTASNVVTSLKTENGVTVGKVKILGATVRFDYINKIGLRLSSTENAKLVVNGKAVTLDGDIYYTEGIHATEFDKVFTFELYEGDTLIQTFTYSVTSYIYSQMNKTADGELTAMAELARALYRYGKSAEAYVNS